MKRVLWVCVRYYVLLPGKQFGADLSSDITCTGYIL
jgi:hypothetical protein